MDQAFFNGADDRIWTGDLILTKDALYRLSYISTLCSTQGWLYYMYLKKAIDIWNLTNEGRAVGIERRLKYRVFFL